MKKQNKKHQNARFIGEKLKTTSLMFFVSFFHVICKISNFNMCTAKHLAQAPCPELTLQGQKNLQNLETYSGPNFFNPKTFPCQTFFKANLL